MSSPTQHGDIVVREAVESELGTVDEFITRQARNPLWLRPAWREPLQVYGLRLQTLVAWRGTTIAGVLPLVCQRSLLFGRRAVSVPWADAGGVLAADPVASDALVKRSVSFLGEQGLSRLVLRQEAGLYDWPVERSDKLAMQLPLPSDPDLLWKSFDPKVRNQVRKAEKSQVVSETVSREEGVAGFFEVYSKNMRDLGSPGHSRRYFEAVATTFSSLTEFHLARCEGRVVGAGLTMANGDRLDIPWASSLQEYNRHCVNHSLYWHMLSRACRSGFGRFYFGRSTRGSGPHHFKKQWGAEEVPLFWYSLDREGRPQVAEQSPQESFGLAVRVWRKMPLGLTRALGPWLISQLD